MAELTKQALKVENNTEFPNNNNGQITPSRLRGFNEDMIDSLVDEISYNADSASWNQQIDALENFTASLGNTFVSTASFNSFTQSINSFTASVTASIVDLQNFSASLSGGFVTEGELQAATASLINQINTKLDSASFNTYTQSNDTKWSNLGAQSGSWITESETGSFVMISSFNAYTQSTDSRLTNIESTTASILIETQNLESFTASANSRLNNIESKTGSYATTGSNNFVGVESINDLVGSGLGEVYLLGRSGSLVLANSTATPTYASLSHLSSSQVNANTNLIFKTNTNTADTIVSGSNNIYVNPAAPSAGFKRFVGTTGNIELNASNVPQISSSMAFPVTMNNNIFTGNGQTLFMRGPVSSSTWTIAGNLIGANTNIGNTAANNAEKVVAGLAMNNNIIYGALTLIANRSTHTQIDSISNNIAMGGMTINANSSSIIHGNNIGNGSVTVNNNFFTTNPTAIANSGNNISTLRNTFTGISHVVNFSGSGILATDGRTPTVQDNVVAGSTNTLFTGADTANNKAALQSTAIIGFNLIVTGSSDIVTATDIGGGFIGRYNAVDGNRARTSQTIFAIGTGTSGSAGIVRKTGFLIDSGSNTYVEGTLNVSGSSTLSGSLYIQSGSTLPVSTGSAILTWDATTGQVNQASYSTIISASVSSGEFWSTTTQSGSAGVSGSITFNNSGSFYNVSLVNGTRLTVGNAGVYNIQFSAQVETSAGADTLWIWFKKNGNNIGDSASKAVLANNTAQVITVNILDQAVANDYYEIAYQNLNGNATVLAEVASGNIPAIPSVIATIFQIR